MPRRYRPGEVIRVLERLGWQQVRIRGDHARLVLPDRRNPVTVPVSRRELDPYVMARILRQAGLTLREFQAVADEVL
jgi:predicted RNA binding protein YcfA (HicA-like mRNA interferase family)